MCKSTARWPQAVVVCDCTPSLRHVPADEPAPHGLHCSSAVQHACIAAQSILVGDGKQAELLDPYCKLVGLLHTAT